jgi:hypothetical protein
MLPAYGGQESDCISPLRDIPAEAHPLLPLKSFWLTFELRRPGVSFPSLSRGLAEAMSFGGASGGHAVTPWANVAEGREMQSVSCPP